MYNNYGLYFILIMCMVFYILPLMIFGRKTKIDTSIYEIKTKGVEENEQ